MDREFFDSDKDWDCELTDEDLRSIDYAVSVASATNESHLKRQALPRCGDDGDNVECPPKTRRRLPDSLFTFQQQQEGISPSFRLSRCGRNNSCVPSYPDIKFGGHIVYRRTVDEVQGAAMELLNFVEGKKSMEGHCILGLDIEWRPTFRRGVLPGKAAVMQICGDKSCCYVFHIFHSQIPHSLKCLLEDATIVKVGVGIANDATKVLRDHNVSINNLLDLSDLANQKIVGDRRNWSLSALTEMLVCKVLPKPSNIRLGNWEVGVLSKEQLKYAATDAYVSWYLYQVMKNLVDTADNERGELLNDENDREC